MVHIGFGVGRVLADHIEPSQHPRIHRLEHLGQMPAPLGRNRPPPDAFDPASEHFVFDVLEAGQLVGDGPHVTAALDIVLAAQGHQTRSVAADVTGQQAPG